MLISRSIRIFRRVRERDYFTCSMISDIIKSITGAEPGKLPKAMAQTFHGLYGFRSGGEGIAHGGASGGAATQGLAEYVLAVASSQIILLVDLANSEETDIPF